ncbi:hypothetical protein [Wielerella bovis]|uniref:hypothetical protein n=1 Tax=Wielerella bovis TaxID=2917790 RepID=UPI002019652A|nr:hypothetical protein [Wielerella bovis]ULJ66653.1 hypothetical protein MIS31_10450 [Wielerella bovis]
MFKAWIICLVLLVNGFAVADILPSRNGLIPHFSYFNKSQQTLLVNDDIKPWERDWGNDNGSANKFSDPVEQIEESNETRNVGISGIFIIAFVMLYFFSRRKYQKQAVPIAIRVLGVFPFLQLMIAGGSVGNRHTFMMICLMYMPVFLHSWGIFGLLHHHNHAVRRYIYFATGALVVNLIGFAIFELPFYQSWYWFVLWYGGVIAFVALSKSVKAAYANDIDSENDELPVINKPSKQLAQTKKVAPQVPHEHKTVDKGTVVANVGHQLLQCLQQIESKIVPVQYFQFDVARAYIAACLYFVYAINKAKEEQSEEVQLAVRCLYQAYHKAVPDATPQLFQTQFGHFYQQFMQTDPNISSPKLASESVARFAYQIGIGQDAVPDMEQQYVTQIATTIFNGMMIIHKQI